MQTAYALPVKRIAPDAVRMERILPGPAERIWTYLTDSEKRGRWFCSGAIEPREGGKATMFFRHSDYAGEPTPERFKGIETGFGFEAKVLAYDPPRLLSYTWPEGEHLSEVTFELFEEGKDVRLMLTHTRLKDRAQMLNISGGWSAHFDVLEDLLAGRKPRGFWTNFLKIEAGYAEAFKD